MVSDGQDNSPGTLNLMIPKNIGQALQVSIGLQKGMP